MSFSRVLGQDQPKQILKKALQNNSVSHAYLFYGPESTGKKLTAIEFAKALNCKGSGPADNCGTCSSCRKISQRIHPDFFLLEPAKSTPSAREVVIRIDSIRELQRKLSYLPYEGETKVAIIDSAETMNLQAANTFLKTLEEPPSSTVLILIAANPYQLLPTIVSRCQGIRFHALPSPVVQTIVEEKMREAGENPGPEEMELRALRSLGRAGRALEEDVLKSGEQRIELLELLGRLSFDRMDVVFQWARTQAKQPGEVQMTLEELLNLLRDLAVLKTGPGSAEIYNRDLMEHLIPLAAQKSLPGLIRMFDSVCRTRSALTANANTQLSLENMLMQFCEAT
ncbi:MAG: DNA polymerase III subunit delta' [Nitrospinaceae bacterium]